MNLRTISSALIVAGALTGLAACSSSDDKAAAPTPQAAKTTKVDFGEYFYRPRTITIDKGDTVRFVNVGKIEHTVADATPSGTIQSRIIKPRPLKTGQSQSVTFRTSGTVYYICTFHPDLMRGVVTVR